MSTAPETVGPTAAWPDDGPVTWQFGAGAVRLVVQSDDPVLLLGVGFAGDAGRDGDHDPAARGLDQAVPLVELALGGEGRTGASPHGQHRRYAAGARLRYLRHAEDRAGGQRTLTVEQGDADTGVRVVSRLVHLEGADAFRATTTVANEGDAPVTLRYVSTMTLAGFVDHPIADDPTRLSLTHARNAWFAECRWATRTLEQCGIVDIGPVGGGNDSSFGHFAARGVGSWSTGDFLPVGAVVDGATGRSWTWQLEHNGPWQWQAMDRRRHLYVGMSGPTDDDHHWSAVLEPGRSFTSVPASVAVSSEGLEGALAQMTAQRRLSRRPSADTRDLPVIFNDYMNCLMGDPTTEALLPLVSAAARAGAEYFVIDAGWYADGPGWWDSVGEWLPSSRRFPGGLEEVTAAITAAGMVPGLWLEPEVVGVNSPLLRRLPREALFARDGSPLTENGRHQLDLRHPAAVEHLDSTVDRLVREFGIGYVKLDYNINTGAGTDAGGLTLGEGLLGHDRAYSRWLDRLHERHPDLVVENCASGGMRMDSSQLSRTELQSTSDQTDPLLYVPIAAAAPAAVPPEQSAVWAYPQPEWSRDLNDLTVVNALLGRVHLSGRLDLLDDRGAGRVREALDVYKTYRHRIPAAVPGWPLGLPGWYDDWCAASLHDARGVLLQVWRRGGSVEVELPIGALAGHEVLVRTLFPVSAEVEATWSADRGVLTVRLPDAPSARLLELVPRS